jgi:hypothetical protein
MEYKRLAAKLLALAIDQAGKPEGELAREKAEELIRCFGILPGDLSVAEARDLVKQRSFSIPSEGWAQELVAEVAYFCACVTIQLSAGQIVMFGRTFHIEVATLYYEQVLRQLDEGLRSISGSGLWTTDQMNDWRASFVLGVAKKLNKMIGETDSDPFRDLREVCGGAACSVLTDQFPRSVVLSSYSQERKRVESAFEVGVNIEVLNGIASSAVALLAEASDPEEDDQL